MRIAEGDNHVIDLEDGVLGVQVVRRPDRDSQSGADEAESIKTHFERGAARVDVRGGMLDLSQAPPVAGPRTQAALGKLIAAFARQRKPIAIVVGGATQRLQMERLATEHGAGRAEVHDEVAAARAWLSRQAGAGAPI